jgi:hypothetical protein
MEVKSSVAGESLSGILQLAELAFSPDALFLLFSAHSAASVKLTLRVQTVTAA